MQIYLRFYLRIENFRYLIKPILGYCKYTELKSVTDKNEFLDFQKIRKKN